MEKYKQKDFQFMGSCLEKAAAWLETLSVVQNLSHFVLVYILYIK